MSRGGWVAFFRSDPAADRWCFVTLLARRSDTALHLGTTLHTPGLDLSEPVSIDMMWMILPAQNSEEQVKQFNGLPYHIHEQFGDETSTDIPCKLLPDKELYR